MMCSSQRGLADASLCLPEIVILRQVFFMIKWYQNVATRTEQISFIIVFKVRAAQQK